MELGRCLLREESIILIPVFPKGEFLIFFMKWRSDEVGEVIRAGGEKAGTHEGSFIGRMNSSAQ